MTDRKGAGPISQGDDGRPISRQCTGHVLLPDGTRRRCRRSADHGTTVCGAHGGAAPQVRRKAAERVTEAKALELYQAYAAPNGDAPDPVDIIASIDRLVGRVEGFEEYLRGRVERLSALPASDQLHIEIVLYQRALAESRKLLVGIGHLGLDAMRTEIERRQARAAEADGGRIFGAFKRGLEGIGLSPEQWDRAREVMPRVLRELAQ